MSDDIKLDQEENKKPLDDQPLESRRRFAKTGLAGSAVVMSLISRSGFASTGSGSKCTMSILESIDAGTSLHDDMVCLLGCSPGIWKGRGQSIQSAWATITANYGFTLDSYIDDSSIWGCGPNITVREALGPYNSAGNPLKQALFQGMAAYLNALYFGPALFGVSAEQVKSSFCNAYNALPDKSLLNAFVSYVTPLNVHDDGSGRTCPISNSN